MWAAHLSSVLWPETMSGSKTLNSKIKKFWANWPSLSPSIGDSFMDGDKGVVVPLSLGTTGHFKEQRGNRIDCFLFLSGNEKLLLIIHLKSSNSTKFFLLCTLIMALAQFQTSYLSFKAVDSLITVQKQKLSLNFETFRVNLIVPFLRHL